MSKQKAMAKAAAKVQGAKAAAKAKAKAVAKAQRAKAAAKVQRVLAAAKAHRAKVAAEAKKAKAVAKAKAKASRSPWRTLVEGHENAKITLPKFARTHLCPYWHEATRCAVKCGRKQVFSIKCQSMTMAIDVCTWVVLYLD